MDFYLEDINSHEPQVAITAFQSIFKPVLDRADIDFLKKNEILDSVENIRRIVYHPCPQNSTQKRYIVENGIFSVEEDSIACLSNIAKNLEKLEPEVNKIKEQLPIDLNPSERFKILETELNKKFPAIVTNKDRFFTTEFATNLIDTLSESKVLNS